MTITAAADGSALGNPGPNGWAWYIDDDNWAAGGSPHGTNNQGELRAVLELLKATAGISDKLHIWCDSRYVIDSVTKWMPGWKRKGWRKSDGGPVLNRDLLEGIDEAMRGRNVEFSWVKGHAGDPLNEAADERANAAAKAYKNKQEPRRGPGFTLATDAAAAARIRSDRAAATRAEDASAPHRRRPASRSPSRCGPSRPICSTASTPRIDERVEVRLALSGDEHARLRDLRRGPGRLARRGAPPPDLTPPRATCRTTRDLQDETPTIGPAPRESPAGRHTRRAYTRTMSSAARTIGRVFLGPSSSSPASRTSRSRADEFQAQVPESVPLDPDVTVLASGVVEVGLGAALLFAEAPRRTVGMIAALFFVAVFPGNLAQWMHHRDGFGLDTDMKRFVRLFFQPVLVALALLVDAQRTPLTSSRALEAEADAEHASVDSADGMDGDATVKARTVFGLLRLSAAALCLVALIHRLAWDSHRTRSPARTSSRI